MPDAHPWTAWVGSGFDAVAVHESLQALRGRRIVAVRYVDLDYGTSRPLWDEGEHDQLGHGVELGLDDGSTWSVTWEQRGIDEGLGVRSEALIPAHVTAGSTWDVTRRWRLRGPRRMVAVQTWWLRKTDSWRALGEPRRTSFHLHALAFRDEDGEALIVLDGRLDLSVYLTPAPALRERALSPELVSFACQVAALPVNAWA